MVCDGWSAGLIISELAQIYSGLMKKTSVVLDAPIPFRTYSLATEADTKGVADAVAYWREQYSTLPPLLDLPTDRPRPSMRTAGANTVKRILDSSVHQSLKKSAGKQRTTLVVLMMAGLKTLLHRLTGQTDLVVGLGAAGQAVTGQTCLVGHCVNMLPIRTQLRPEASFQENLATVKTNILNAYDHHQASIGEILQQLKVPRSMSRVPLMEVIFNIDRDAGTSEFSGLEFSVDRNPKRALHFDLFFNVTEGPHGLVLECDYNTDVFDGATIDRWLGHYQTLLEGIAENPSETIAHLPLLTEAERRELVIDRNNTGVDVPKDLSLHGLFERQVARTPGSAAVTFEGQQLTYRELEERANQLAHHLKSQGVGPDIAVGILVERSLDMVVGVLGILKAGGLYVPLDPSFPADRLAYMVEDSRMPVLVTHRGLDERLSLRAPTVVRLDSDWDRIAVPMHTAPGTWNFEQQNLAYRIYTSGSTGKPKGVEIPHSAIVNFLLSMQREPGLHTDDTLLAVTTLSFDIAGLELYLPLLCGGHLVLASRDDAYDPARLMQRMRESGCNVMQATPATWRALVQAGWEGSENLKILCGGEPLPRDLAAELLSRCGELWNLYGPTETTVWSTIYRVTSADRQLPIGTPIANTSVFVLDGNRQLAPLGVAGELYIGGIGLARGYWNRSELTEEKFVPNPFTPGERLYRTGDLVRYLPDGNLDFLGRIDNQVKIRGFRIELGEIETVLGRHEEIGQCVVVAREDTPGDKILVAYFESSADPAPDAAALRAHLKKDLPDYMVPSAFVRMEKLPLTPNGKVDRKALLAPAERQIEARGDFAPPRDPLEHTLAQAWSKILKVKQVGLHDDFFELGGHSLAAVRLLSEIQKITGKNLPLATLFHASTVEALANILREEGWKPSWSSLVPIQPRGSKPPLFLIHGAEGNVLLYRQVTQYLEPDQPVYGLQSLGLNGDVPPQTTVPEMAAAYVKEVLTVQPTGPYYLGGYCLGGIIAYEMAQQLTALGEKVELVTMLETYNEHVAASLRIPLQEAVHAAQNVWYHAANAASLHGEDRKKFVREKMDTELTRFRIRLSATGYPHLLLKKINDKAAEEYVPKPYTGRVALIRPKTYFSGLATPGLGWSDFVREGLEIHELPIYPKGMLIEPFCRLLAETLSRCLSHA
jgi:amino acid adenylation domain-containing protein